LPIVLTLGIACGSPTEKPLVATPVPATTTSIVGQAPLPIDAGVTAPAAPQLPKLACADGATPARALYPELAWYCARADGVRHGPFFTLHPDHTIEIEGSYADGKLDGAWQRRYPNGAIAEVGAYTSGRRDGVWKQLGPGGDVLGEYTMKQGTGKQKRWLADGPLYSEVTLKSGVPHGPSKIFDRNGQLVVAANLYAGKLDGKHVVGSKNTLRIEETFARGVRRGPRLIWQFWSLVIDETYDRQGRLHGPFSIMRDRKTPRLRGEHEHGKRTGTWIWTDKNNKKEREGDFSDDRKRGLWSEWVDGKLTFQGTFDDGKPDGEFVYYDVKTGNELGRFTITGGTGTMLTFHTNKKVATKQQLKRGLMDGSYEELTPRGKTIVLGRYASDNKHGLWREQTEAGVPTLEQNWKRGKLDGAWKKFTDGKLSAEGTYKDGLAEGTYTEYRDGKPALVGQFIADKRTGTWTAYDADGSVTLVATYVDGVLDGPWRQRVAGGVLDGQLSRGHRAGTWIQTDRAGQKQSVTYPTP
jgi:antitoxin component YwqK of YwqJK toxin-antitoxin module